MSAVKYQVVLKNLKAENEIIVLVEATTPEVAQEFRRNWRRVLGGKRWTVERRPGLDTLDHLALTVIVTRGG